MRWPPRGWPGTPGGPDRPARTPTAVRRLVRGTGLQGIDADHPPPTRDQDRSIDLEEVGSADQGVDPARTPRRRRRWPDGPRRRSEPSTPRPPVADLVAGGPGRVAWACLGAARPARAPTPLGPGPKLHRADRLANHRSGGGRREMRVSWAPRAANPVKSRSRKVSMGLLSPMMQARRPSSIRPSANPGPGWSGSSVTGSPLGSARSALGTEPASGWTHGGPNGLGLHPELGEGEQQRDRRESGGGVEHRGEGPHAVLDTKQPVPQSPSSRRNPGGEHRPQQADEPPSPSRPCSDNAQVYSVWAATPESCHRPACGTSLLVTGARRRGVDDRPTPRCPSLARLDRSPWPKTMRSSP